MMLQLKNITLSFSGGRGTFKILDSLNLCVERGKITALVGGNGTGKTTLFNIISGFQKDCSGEIVFNDKKINTLSPSGIARQGIGRLFQGKSLLPDLTLLENMKLHASTLTEFKTPKGLRDETPFAYLFRSKRQREIENTKEARAIEVLNNLFGNENKYLEMLHTLGSDFSYGEQRLLSLAGLFMGSYSLLLLDEPTAGVNPVYIEQIRRIIRQMAGEGKTILLIEHNMQFVRDIADKVVYLDNGKIQFEGTATEVLNNQEVKNSYLGVESITN
ncbi:MAG: ATP-binding cassette domain-containing protein [Prevotellaceae bacterium]|jgi:branched-chain amino acid transport system ATP-binding protein|nr:ATP-binding cassette domain-containing protein [Prevotellaceae bacterium]